MDRRIKDAQFLLQDLAEHGPQTSWDWPADWRFAKFLGDKEAIEFYEWALRGESRHVVLIATVRLYGKRLVERRLRALQFLVKQGKVEAAWAGTGEMGVHTFGINRARVYSLKKPETQVSFTFEEHVYGE